MLFRDYDTQRRDTSYDNLSNIDIQYNFQGPFFSPPNSLVFNHLLKKDVTFYIQSILALICHFGVFVKNINIKSQHLIVLVFWQQKLYW